jgi:lysophospholipase L1-like esterase
MKSVWTYLKLGVINVGVLLILLWSLNFIASVYLDGKYLYKQVFVPINEKAYTESLPDQEQAYLIYREKKQLETQYVPYVAWARKPFSGKTITINSEGERTHHLMADQPVKHVRFFGGSTMWGTGVDDRNTIPAHFNELHQDYRVYNHGQSGFVSRQELARLINLVNQNAKMDVVIFYDGCNDSHSVCEGIGPINSHREAAKMSEKLEHHWQVTDALTGSIRTIIQKVVKGGKEPPSKCLKDPAYAKLVASTMVNNWKIAQSVAALGGAEFHAILQPVAVLGQPNIEYLKPRASKTNWHVVYPLVQEIKEREHLDWIHDFTDAFDVKEYIYIDGCHVNGRGNQIIARRLSELLKQL